MDGDDNEVVEHFNKLYPLDKPDWKGRWVVEGVQPVQNSENSGGKELFVDTWVADVAIHRSISSLMNNWHKLED